MNQTGIGTLVLAGLLGLGAGACNGGGEDPPVGDVHGEMPMEGMEGMEHMEGMESMEGMMARHAQEADSMTAVMRQHVQQMRQLPPEQWHDRMEEHVTRVSQMLNLMNRQMREMDMGMDMGHERMSEMMGMSGEEHRRMADEMQALRSDLEQLQTASGDQVRDRMPDHLDRLDRMLEMMERAAAHMGAM